MSEREEIRIRLRELDDRLTGLIALADENGDHLLGALLSEAHAHVVKRYSDLNQA